MDNKKRWKWGYGRCSPYLHLHANWLGFRNGPVPGIHKWPAGGCMYKRPATRRERALGYDRDLRQYIRGKRSPSSLPTNYDDIPNNNHGKSWKRQKKRKQWM